VLNGVVTGAVFAAKRGAEEDWIVARMDSGEKRGKTIRPRRRITKRLQLFPTKSEALKKGDRNREDGKRGKGDREKEGRNSGVSCP